MNFIYVNRALLASMLSLCLAGCLSQAQLNSSSLSDLNSGSGSGGGAGKAAAPLSISAVKQQLNLGAAASIPVTISSANGYSGMVSLSLDTKLLAANDPMSMVTASISPASVNVSPGNSAQASVSIAAAAGAPDMDISVNIVAQAGSQQVVAAAPFQILPVFEVDIMGPPGADETWSLPEKSTTKFTQHKNGITIVFKNKDATAPSAANKAHRIHSSGTAFLHEGDGATGKGEGMGLPGSTTPLTVDNPPTSSMPAQTAGDTYTVVVTSQAAQLSDTFYCHQHEDPATASRTMIFNAYSAPPVIGNSGNPNASYAYLQKNIFTPICGSCHISKNPVDGGVDLGTYASVSAYVQPGAAAGSSLYAAVTTGGMPYDQNLAPGTPLTAAQLQAISDWINDGAKNN